MNKIPVFSRLQIFSKMNLNLLVLALFILISQISKAQVTFDNIVLTNATLIDANHTKALEHQTVMIQNGTIKEIFTDGSRNVPDSANVISMNGKYIVPGLIDTHVHMATDPTDVD